MREGGKLTQWGGMRTTPRFTTIRHKDVENSINKNLYEAMKHELGHPNYSSCIAFS